jgi:hypothetical protein
MRTSIEEASRKLGCSGFVVHSVSIATFCVLRFGDDPKTAIVEAIRAGGDTDSNAAIVGAWVGGAHGESGLPAGLIEQLNDRDWFGVSTAERPALAGPTHLRALANALVSARRGIPREVSYSWLGALLRNIFLYPVVLVHAFRVFFAR